MFQKTLLHSAKYTSINFTWFTHKLSNQRLSNNLLIFYYLCIYFIGEVMNLSDLQNKDIINIFDGKKIGNIIDARFNPINGIIEKLILSPSKSLFSLKNSTIEIGFNKIKKIGEDVILIEYLNK